MRVLRNGLARSEIFRARQEFDNGRTAAQIAAKYRTTEQVVNAVLDIKPKRRRRKRTEVASDGED